MAKAFRLAKAVPYKHPSGALIWVTLSDDVALANAPNTQELKT